MRTVRSGGNRMGGLTEDGMGIVNVTGRPDTGVLGSLRGFPGGGLGTDTLAVTARDSRVPDHERRTDHRG